MKPVACVGSSGPGARAVDGSRLRIGSEFTHRRTDFPFCLQPFRRESSRTQPGGADRVARSYSDFERRGCSPTMQPPKPTCRG